MGYNIHITRKKHWSDQDGPEISLQEWTDYVKSDPEMRLEGFAQFNNPRTGETIRLEGPGLAVWTAHSGKPGIRWFDCRHGHIAVKNPDPEVFAKMWHIAHALSAKVQGDDGEIYDQTGNIIG